MSLRISKNLLRNNYIKSLYTTESKAQQGIIASIEENNLPSINLSLLEVKIVQILIKLSGISTIVEFGTHAGYSAASMAEALPDDGRIHTFEKDPRTAHIATENFKKFELDKKIEVITGDAHTNLQTFKPSNLDMVFIDAEKQGYPDYLKWAYKNVKTGGLIIADNAFLFEAVYEPEIAKKTNDKLIAAMQEFNELLADRSKFESIILPTDDGLSVAIKI